MVSTDYSKSILAISSLDYSQYDLTDPIRPNTIVRLFQDIFQFFNFFSKGP